MLRLVLARFRAVVTLFLLVGSVVLAQEQWVPTGLSDPAARCVAVSPTNPDLILAGGQYLHVSHDAGVTWSTFTAATEIWTVGFGSNSNVAYAGGWGSGIRYSDDGGVTWSARNNGLSNTVVKAIVVSPVNNSLVFAGAEDGIYRSINGGLDWTRVQSGINVSAIATSQSEPNKMYLGTWGASVWKSLDSGLTWSLVQAAGLPTSCQSIAVDPTNNAIVFVMFQSGVWRTLDDGSVWQQITPGYEGFSVALDPARPGFVYGVGGWTTPKRSGCYGALYGWRGMDPGWNAGWFSRAITVAPGVPGLVYACGANGGLFKWASDITASEPASNLVANDIGSAIALAWDPSPSPECVGYWIYRWENAQPFPLTPFGFVNGNQSASYIDSNVEAGISYVYVVAAVDGAENSSTLI